MNKRKNRQNIINFIRHLNEKDFAKANQSLQSVLHEKIKSRIATVAKKPLF